MSQFQVRRFPQNLAIWLTVKNYVGILDVHLVCYLICILGLATLSAPCSRCQNVKATKQLPFPNPPAAQESKGGYWRDDHTFQPTLIITSVLEERSLTVTPCLYAADGTEYDLPAVSLPPSGVAYVDVHSALESAPASTREHFGHYGSVGVKYVWNWSGAITTLIQNRDARRSLNFNFDLRSVGGTHHATASPTTMQGLWWKEDDGITGFLGLVNTGRHPLNVAVRILSESGEPMDEYPLLIFPNETKRLDILQQTGGSSGGIEIFYDGVENDLVVAGGLENAAEGYSARIPFAVADKGAPATTISVSSVGIMFGKQDPSFRFPEDTRFGVYLDMRNTTDRSVAVTPTIYYSAGQQPKKSALAPLVLAPRQSRHWTPQQFASELSIDGQPGFVNLIFSYDGSLLTSYLPPVLSIKRKHTYPRVTLVRLERVRPRS